jgi:hypothetical protein
MIPRTKIGHRILFIEEYLGSTIVGSQPAKIKKARVGERVTEDDIEGLKMELGREIFGEQEKIDKYIKSSWAGINTAILKSPDNLDVDIT